MLKKDEVVLMSGDLVFALPLLHFLKSRFLKYSASVYYLIGCLFILSFKMCFLLFLFSSFSSFYVFYLARSYKK